MFTPSVYACAGIRCVHGEDVCADTHELGFTHQLTNGWCTRGERSGKLLSGHPRLRSSVSRQLCFRSVLLEPCGYSSLEIGKSWTFIDHSPNCLMMYGRTCPPSKSDLSFRCELLLSFLQRHFAVRLQSQVVLPFPFSVKTVCVLLAVGKEGICNVLRVKMDHDCRYRPKRP